jgi:alkylhydroperoxidase/carboxymuconolactone decarboxylase family protein YurZ
MANDDQLAAAWEYARSYYKDPEVEREFELLSEFQPEVFSSYMAMRSGLFKTPPDGALDRKTKELVILGIELMGRKTNPPPVGHTRKAIESGATPKEISEVVGLAIMLGGMITFRESGRFVLREAVDHANRLADGTDGSSGNG